MRKKILDKPQKVRTSLEELEVLARLRGSVEWAILKRLMQRYVTSLKSFAYNLPYSISAEDFKVKHREATAQALAFKRLVKMVEGAGKEAERREKNAK